MATNLATINPAAMSVEQISLIKSTIAKNASDDELKLFLYRCQHMGLDPLKPGQIHFVKYGSSQGTIVIGIEGFRLRAGRTGKHSGTKRGILRDPDGKCIGAWAEVYRNDWQQPAREEVSFAEYNTGKANWQKMPETMIKKVAESAALRMAFPDELGGVYSDDEMDQAKEKNNQAKADTVQELISAPVPIESKSVESTEPYKVPFGFFNGKTLAEIPKDKLSDYCDIMVNKAKAEKKEIQGQLKEFLSRAYDFLQGVS